MRPRECRMSTEDLECVGCGVKLHCLTPGQCSYEDWEQQEKERKEREERVLLARLKAKYEDAP